MQRISLLMGAGICAFLLSCRGKQGPEGPQGPPGRDLVRPQQGFIEGVARGKDESGNAFSIPFRYTYYFGAPGEAQRVDANTLSIAFYREDSLGVGNLSISFTYNRNNRQASDVTLSGLAANATVSPIPVYTIQLRPEVGGFAGTSQSVTNLELSGDTLISGEFSFINPQFNPPLPVPGFSPNTYPDTVRGRFSVRLIPIISYGRGAQ
ncbi:MAG: hypothetical protein RMK19_00330 [Bacteroidia bacterium]|nr:hypothetical protein [Bacteroidia bacterium]MDW8014443.1 hypothetical protein [Bacteroidia bacterium]